MTTILWLRNDLRLTDNPALTHAALSDRLLPVYIHPSTTEDPWAAGAASRWWLHHSLGKLAGELQRRGSGLLIREGDPAQIIEELAQRTGARRVTWNRRYDPAGRALDDRIENRLSVAGIEVATFNASLLFEPGEIRRADGGPYRVFTAFWKSCLATRAPSAPLAAPARLPPSPALPGEALADLGLTPAIPWDGGLREHWEPGEDGALRLLQAFSTDALADYNDHRDRPDLSGTARLSPYLHFGEIGPRQIHASLHARAEAGGFLRQLGWREFAHHLLVHFPHTPESPLNPRFAAFPWRENYGDDLSRWQRGTTGIPLVDAGMRELWHTGWMHNRVRMVAASFLTKNLLIPWQEGVHWFWDTLVDADLANNTLGWQWVAGSGANAAPYFRIFNPVLQGERFDPEGHYVRRWIPELECVPDRFVHQPWRAPSAVLAGLPGDSPCVEPIVDLRTSRERALEAYKKLP